MPLPLHFQTEVKALHVRAATVGIFRRQVFQPLVLGLVAVFLFGMQLTLHVFFSFVPFIMHLALALLVLASLAGLAWTLQRHYEKEALRNFSRFMGAPIQVRLGPEAYQYSATWGQGQVPWSDFESLWRFKDVWVLLQHRKNGVSVLLPAADLADDAQEFIAERLMRAKMERHQ
jgi:hypothetical protein